MPRFVVLEHDHPTLHWDLMLESSGILQTWRLAKPPESESTIEATLLGDHRLTYLNYEGPVSSNRGNVRRWDAGTFTDEPDSSPAVRRLVVAGARLRGRVRLEKVDLDTWFFVWLAT